MAPHLSCEFCSSRIGPILPQDMGEGRVMHLCAQCRRYIREGIEQDAKALAKAVVPHIHTVIRNATGQRGF